MSNHDEIESWLNQLLARALRVPKNKIDPNITFDRLGVDSTTAVALALDIEEHFGLQMNETVLFDYPSIGELSKYLAQSLPSQEQKERNSSAN